MPDIPGSPGRIHVGNGPSMNAGLPSMAWNEPESKRQAGPGKRGGQRPGESGRKAPEGTEEASPAQSMVHGFATWLLLFYL